LELERTRLKLKNDQYPILYIRSDLLKETKTGTFNEDTHTTHQLHLRANFRLFDWKKAATQCHKLDVDLHVYSDILDIETSKHLSIEERDFEIKSIQGHFIICIIGQLVKKYFPGLLKIGREQHFDETKEGCIIENENDNTGVVEHHRVEDQLFYRIYTVRQGHYLIVFDGRLGLDTIMSLLEHNYMHLLDKGVGHVFEEISLSAIDIDGIINADVELNSYFDRFVT
jgi:hypothetical protein